jgi:hypothetical protein
LERCDPAFSAWYKRGRSRRTAKDAALDFKSQECLLNLLEDGRIRTDVGNEVLEELGFGIGLWNGCKAARMVGLRVTCGSNSSAEGVGDNCVVIDLPDELGELEQCERMAKLVVAMATSWEPDWCGVFSSNAMNERGFDPAIPFVDWMLYVSKGLLPNPTVPEPSSITSVEGIGSLVIIRPGPSKEPSGHLRSVKAVERALGIQS